MRSTEHPLYTTELDQLTFSVPPGSTLIIALNDEDRSSYTKEWLDDARARGVLIITLLDQDPEFVVLERSGIYEEIYLHDLEDLDSLANNIEGICYLDITAMLHRTWAPLVRMFIKSSVELRVVYFEPGEYHRTEALTPGRIYNLSDRFLGIAPLPGFARLAESPEDSSLFVPMVGFEGPRLQQVMNDVEIERSRIYPIIGLPGFRAEYPFYAYIANRDNLALEYLHSRIVFAKANCPFTAFHALLKLHRETQSLRIRVAPVGTKPHALGAVLYAIAHESLVELIYDHPIRSAGRTEGQGKLCLYDVTAFVKASLFSTPVLEENGGPI